MSILSDFRAIVKRILPDIIALRRELHRMPEIACEEYDTSGLIRRSLAGLGVKLLPPFIGTDVVGILAGGRPGPNVMLRADMHALPIEEKSGVPYASGRKGMMHACGHDGHMAMLVGAARVLDRLAPRLAGSVRFVFQPGEEVRAAGAEPGEGRGAAQPAPGHGIRAARASHDSCRLCRRDCRVCVRRGGLLRDHGQGQRSLAAYGERLTPVRPR